jgi:hypothetical protein
MARRRETLERMRSRIARLNDSFSECLDFFASSSLFTGPSLYFHLKTTQIRRQHATARQAIQDEKFVEYLYATLTAWGMHRMGNTAARLVDFDEMAEGFRRQAHLIAGLENENLMELEPSAVERTAQDLWNIISARLCTFKPRSTGCQ